MLHGMNQHDQCFKLNTVLTKWITIVHDILNRFLLLLNKKNLDSLKHKRTGNITLKKTRHKIECNHLYFLQKKQTSNAHPVESHFGNEITAVIPNIFFEKYFTTSDINLIFSYVYHYSFMVTMVRYKCHIDSFSFPPRLWN